MIGGCSAHNGCIVIWGSRADYDGWAAAGNDGWSTAEVASLLPSGRRHVSACGISRWKR